MLKFRLASLLTLAGTLLLVVGAFAADPVALVVEGQTANGLPVGQTVASINTPAVNHSGGWGFTFNASDGTNTFSTVWGSAADGPGDVLRVEGTFPPYEQTSFESFWGLGGGGVVSYSPSCINTESGTTGLDGVWLDDVPVAVEEKDYPHAPDLWWSFGSRPAVTEDGVPYFVGGVTDTQGGSTDFRGLFYGHDAAPVFIGGDVLPGLPAPLSTGPNPSFDYRFSAYGTHHIAEVDMDTGSSTNNNAMVIDAAGLFIDGELVKEASPVPAAAGGLPDENWDNFDYAGVTEDGSYMFTGDTDGATTTDEIVVIDGNIVLREGDVLAGLTLSGGIQSGYMNDDGDYAVIWDVNLPTGENVEVLIFNGQVVLMEGDFIDADGDGVPEPDVTVDDFTGIAALAVTDRTENNAVTVYFTADVSTPDAPPAAADQFLPADEEAGREEVYAAEDVAEQIIEIGYGLTFGGAIPVMLSQFECEAQPDGVHISWNVVGNVADPRFSLRADNGDRSWDVPYTRTGGNSFTALDRRAVGETVTYTLLLEADGQDLIIGEQGVRLELPTRGVTVQNVHPNPFNPEAKINFRVGATQHVELAVYDMGGRLVNLLADQVFTVGLHQLSWNGRDLNGAAVPSGTYVARIRGEQSVESVKLMLVK